MELLYSWERGKYNIVVTNGQKISHWLIYHSHHVCESLDEALELFKKNKGIISNTIKKKRKII